MKQETNTPEQTKAFKEESEVEAFLCGGRPYASSTKPLPNYDIWTTRPNGDRTCSLCGSLHPDDFKRILTEAADIRSFTWIDASRDGLMWPVHRPDILNGAMGGLRFFNWHSPSIEWCDEINQLLPEATRVSVIKYKRHLNQPKIIN